MWITISGYIYSLLQPNCPIFLSIQTCPYTLPCLSLSCVSVGRPQYIGQGDTEEGHVSLIENASNIHRGVWWELLEKKKLCCEPTTTTSTNGCRYFGLAVCHHRQHRHPPLLQKMNFSWWHNVVTGDVEGRKHDDIKNYYY